MNQSEKLPKLARMIAERNLINIREGDLLAEKGSLICYEFTKLFRRIWIAEWQKLLKEKEK